MRHRRVAQVVALSCLLSGLLSLSQAWQSASAKAQDMTFNVEETGQPPAPPAEGPPSEALAV